MSNFLRTYDVIPSNAMRFILTAVIVGVFAYLPVWAFDSLVLPQLNSLSHLYQSAGDTADRIAPDKE